MRITKIDNMRSFRLFLLICLVAFQGLGLIQSVGRNDLADLKLKGPVSSLSEWNCKNIGKIDSIDYQCRDYRLNFKYSFNKSGNFVQSKKFNETGELKSHDYYLYQDNLCTEIQGLDSAGNITKRTVNQYNKKGQITEAKFYLGDGSYDGKTIHKRKKEIWEGYNYDSEGNLKFKSKLICGKWDWPEEIQIYFTKKSLESNIPDNTMRHKFDSKGNYIEKYIGYGNQGGHRELFKYDDYGNVIWHDNRPDSDLVGRILTYKYKYDDHNNWILKEEYEDDNPIPISVSRREITYWD